MLVPACKKAPETIVVGSQNVTGQVIVGEIVAQHLEHRLGRKVQRRLGIGSDPIVYQEIETGGISLYPVYTGLIETEILKEQPSSDPGVVWARAHQELSRTARLELLVPLGYDNPPAVVVRVEDAGKSPVSTLSEAAAGTVKWKIGVSYEFEQRIDGIPAINSYKLPMAQVIRSMETAELFPALQRGDLSMIVTDTTDGRLTLSEYRQLADDKHAFPPYQACLLVRQDVLAAAPQLSEYLKELSGKFTTASVSKMSAEVDLQHRKAADVASDFLALAGLK